MHSCFEQDLADFVGNYFSKLGASLHPSSDPCFGPSRSLTPGSEQAGPEMHALRGDAGFRRYYRVLSDPTMIAVYAPPETEKNAQFITVAELLREHGLRSPRILDADLSRGLMLLEDFGDDVLLPHLEQDEADGLYRRVFDTLHRLHGVPCNREVFPTYDKALLVEEMSLFRQWYLQQLLNIQTSADEDKLLDDLMDELAARALAQTQVVVHRDFHSRNLMLLDQGDIGLIDFQDALIGPFTYDLVSLLKDCYVRWPMDQVEAWALAFARSSGLDVDDAAADVFLKDFHFMGLQRHLKVLGIFARLHLRDGKSSYLADLPRVLDYVVEVSQRYPELGAFADFLQQRVLPNVQRFE